MFKKLTITAAILSATLSGQAMAQEDINPWKHCGIGAMIFDDNGTAAAISNIIWDLGTTAVSSKISSADSCEGKMVTAAVFIQDNFSTVMEETSQGSGEHLSAMLDILSIDDAQRADVIAGVRHNIAENMSKRAAITPEAYYNAVVASI